MTLRSLSLSMIYAKLINIMPSILQDYYSHYQFLTHHGWTFQQILLRAFFLGDGKVVTRQRNEACDFLWQNGAIIPQVTLPLGFPPLKPSIDILLISYSLIFVEKSQVLHKRKLAVDQKLRPREELLSLSKEKLHKAQQRMKLFAYWKRTERNFEVGE